MNKQARVALVVLLVAAAGGWFWWTRTSSAEREIRSVFEELAAEFNASTTDGLGTVARAARLGQHFTEDVTVELGQGSPPIQGRETVIGMAARLQPRTSAFVVELDDVSVTPIDDEHAEVTLTVVIRRRVMITGEESLDAREFSTDVRRIDGRWRISRVVAVDTLR